MKTDYLRDHTMEKSRKKKGETKGDVERTNVRNKRKMRVTERSIYNTTTHERVKGVNHKVQEIIIKYLSITKYFSFEVAH